MSHFQCTFFELAIALEAETNVCLGGAYADVQKKSNLLQTALKFLCKHSKMQFQRIGGGHDNKRKQQSYKQLFEAAPQQSTRPITGVWLYGIERKPQWIHGDDTEDVIAANLFRARIHYEEHIRIGTTSATGNVLADQAKSFGTGFQPKVNHRNIQPQWIAPPKMQIECDIHAHCDSLIASNAANDSKCHFGHTTQARKYKQDLLPLWRGAPNGAILCYRCRHRLNFEVDTKEHPVITTASLPPCYRRSPVIQGPCVFGHKTTSAQGKYGVAVWHQIPDGKTWRGAVANDTLCSACFQKMKRSRDLEDNARNDGDNNMSVDEYFESIRKRTKLAICNQTDKAQGSGDGPTTTSCANDDKKTLGDDPSYPFVPAASNLLTVTKQISRVPDMSTLHNDNNSCITSFSAKRSQLQARLVCGISVHNSKKMRVNPVTPNNVSSTIFNSSVINLVLNPNNSSNTASLGSVASAALGFHVNPKNSSLPQTPDYAALSSSGTKGQVKDQASATATADIGNPDIPSSLCKSISIRKPKTRHLYHQGSTKRARITSSGSVPLGEPDHVFPLAKLTNGDTATHKYYINSTPFCSDAGGDLSPAPQSPCSGRVVSNECRTRDLSSNAKGSSSSTNVDSNNINDAASGGDTPGRSPMHMFRKYRKRIWQSRLGIRNYYGRPTTTICKHLPDTFTTLGDSVQQTPDSPNFRGYDLSAHGNKGFERRSSRVSVY
jgi:hypothetical protein